MENIAWLALLVLALGGAGYNLVLWVRTYLRPPPTPVNFAPDLQPAPETEAAPPAEPVPSPEPASSNPEPAASAPAEPPNTPQSTTPEQQAGPR